MPKKQIVLDEFQKPTGVIRFLFEDETVQEINVHELNDDMKLRLMIHGASQKGGDSYAGAKAEANPVAFAKEAVADVIKQLREGNWRVTSPGGPRVTDLATVFAQIQGITLEEAVEFIGGLSEDETKALRKKPKINAALLALSAKRAAEKAAKAAEAAEKEDAAA